MLRGNWKLSTDDSPWSLLSHLKDDTKSCTYTLGRKTTDQANRNTIILPTNSHLPSRGCYTAAADGVSQTALRPTATQRAKCSTFLDIASAVIWAKPSTNTCNKALRHEDEQKYERWRDGVIAIGNVELLAVILVPECEKRRSTVVRPRKDLMRLLK